VLGRGRYVTLLSDTDAGNAYLGPERLGRPTLPMGSSLSRASPAGYLATQRTSSLGPHFGVGEPVSVDVPLDPKIHAPPSTTGV